ncbi:hypothetical protein NG895_03040 [Aeoliella sp. ICT_H6.2]|uniref:Uncharacterized protein n=1 Tax=Aeoliella straminimaris TaxID=2954799 RepID=A0A9X2F614_9BACT|nr:hypothetical protein [Aeoliella straminimaris]MCO6042875.1 hypothetical protein [Aeoliella straminimaris]
MDKNRIPVAFLWFVPVVEELTSESFISGSSELSSESLELLEDKLDRQVRQAIESWIDQDDTSERTIFYMAMVKLDELGLLRDTEPTLDYAYWHSQMFAEIWGDRRAAIRQIGSGFLDGLSHTEREELIRTLERNSETEDNPNTQIWLMWLLAHMEQGVSLKLEKIKELTFDSDEDEYDVLVDGCEALLTLPGLTSSDYYRIEEIMFSNETDEFDAACILVAWLQSDFTTEESKARVWRNAKNSRNSELRQTALEHDNFETL